jgi:hypothetical protein
VNSLTLLGNMMSHTLAKLSACFVLVFAGCFISGRDHPNRLLAVEPKTNFVWLPPFTEPSESKPTSTLRLLLITDDDPFAPADNGENAKPWCADFLQDSLRELFERRPALQKEMLLQHAAVGLPDVLTANTPASSARRCIVVMTDNEHRLLSLAIGIPDGEILQRLIEDAEEVKRLITSSAENYGLIQNQLRERSRQRVDRSWQAVVENLSEELPGRVDEHHLTAGPKTPIRWPELLHDLAERIHPFFLQDTLIRFGLTGETASARRVQLEQHPQTRAPWCEAVIPFLFAADLKTLVVPLAEIIWEQPVVFRTATGDAWTAKWNQFPEDVPIVLRIRPPTPKRDVPWPPPSKTKIAARVGVDWQGLDEMLRAEPFFEPIEISDLALLIRKTSVEPIDLMKPSLARYLYFPRKSARPIVIREKSLPARYFGMIKRSKR